MSTYFSFFRMRFLTLIQYRAAAAAGVATQWVFGMMMILVLYAFYRSSDAAQPMTFSQAATYIWIGQAMLGILPWSADREIRDSVLTGQVAYELIRPIDLYGMWFARTVASRTAPTLLRALPQFVIALWIVPAPFCMQVPSLGGALAWLLSIFCAVLLSVSIINFMHALILRTIRSEGIVLFIPTLSMILGGSIIPLRLMPDWIQPFLRLQPFAGVMDLPSQLFCGSMSPENVLWICAVQIFWIAVFVLWGRNLMQRGIRRVSVAGG